MTRWLRTARKLLRQIEESEERAELVEQKMAKALAVEIPKLELSEQGSKSESGTAAPNISDPMLPL